ncbi:hypothetical protein Pelo_4146 [Pelomyxa schiedti]|nr:hypothetical protein Pelo_4146 [Pelomyxa schiedti]
MERGRPRVAQDGRPSSLLALCRTRLNTRAVRIHAAVALLLGKYVVKNDDDPNVMEQLKRAVALSPDEFMARLHQTSEEVVVDDGVLPPISMGASDPDLAAARLLLQDELNEPLPCDLKYLLCLQSSPCDDLVFFVKKLVYSSNARMGRSWRPFSMNTWFTQTEPPLLEHVRNGDTNLVCAMLQLGAALDVTQLAPNASALHIAADLGHLAIVQLLVKAGANFHTLPWTSSKMLKNRDEFSQQRIACDDFIRQQLFQESLEEQQICTEVVPPLFVLAAKELKRVTSLRYVLDAVPEIMHKQINRAWNRKMYTPSQREPVFLSLASKYKNGNGVKRDLAEATRWTIEAAKIHCAGEKPDPFIFSHYCNYKSKLEQLIQLGASPKACKYLSKLNDFHHNFNRQCEELREREYFEEKLQELQISNESVPPLFVLATKSLKKVLRYSEIMGKVPISMHTKVNQAWDRKQYSRWQRYCLLVEIASLYEIGKGAPKDLGKASEYILEAAKLISHIKSNFLEEFEKFKDKLELLRHDSVQVEGVYLEFMNLYHELNQDKIAKTLSLLQSGVPVCQFHQINECHFGSTCKNVHIPKFMPPDLVAKYTKARSPADLNLQLALTTANPVVIEVPPPSRSPPSKHHHLINVTISHKSPRHHNPADGTSTHHKI